jgi:hypothetical protein
MRRIHAALRAFCHGCLFAWTVYGIGVPSHS